MDFGEWFDSVASFVGVVVAVHSDLVVLVVLSFSSFDSDF